MTQALNLANFANNLNTAGATSNSGLQNSSVTVTAGTGMSGGGAVALGSSVTLTNAGVTSIVAGTGISVSGSIGAVTVSRSGAGLVQIQSTTLNSLFSTSSTTFTNVTGLSATIIPSSTSNKILVTVNLFFGTDSDAALTVFNLVRNSTNISQPATTPAFSGTAGCFIAISDNTFPVSFSYLDSPATTSATTYKVQTKTNSGTLYFNGRQTGDSAYTSTITVMEISA